MFCEACGTELQPGSRVCSKCGRELIGYEEIKRDRLARHVQLLGIFWVTYSVLHLIGGLALMVLANTLFVHLRSEGAPSFLQPLMSMIAMFLFIKGALGIATGWGLLVRAAWARVMSIILGFLSMVNVPFGTALGIYTVWVLLSPGADVEYSALAERG